MQNLKRALETSEKARDILYKETCTYSEEELLALQKFESLTDQIRKARVAKKPDPSCTTSDIPMYIKNTAQQEVFLQFDSGQNDLNRVVVFGTEDSFIHVAKSSVVLSDGTFKYAPPGFLQLYTFMIYLKGSYIPLIFVLMKRKNMESYRILCEFLVTKMPTFNPSHFILDFEYTARIVFSHYFKQTTFSGCLFHFSQIIWRKLQKEGMAKAYRTNAKNNLNVRLLLSLAFVPCDKVNGYYDELIKVLKIDKDFDYSNILTFFEANYMKKMECNDFISFWNVSMRTLEGIPRTSNALEGFHGGLNNLFIKSHPDIGLFGEELLKENLVSNKKLLNILYKNYKLKQDTDLKLRKIIEEIDLVDKITYLKKIAYEFHYPMDLQENKAEDQKNMQ